MAMLRTRSYSERLGVIEDRQLQAACDRCDLGALDTAEAASEGLWGQNILLSTSHGEFVLRGDPLATGQLVRERVVAGLINERSPLPVPWPYVVVDDPEPFGWPYAVMPRLHGSTGSAYWAGADATTKLELAGAHGVALAELHEAAFDVPGPYDETQQMFVAVEDFGIWTLGRIEALRTRARGTAPLAVDAERYIDMLIESCSPAFTEPFVPVLVHHDFSLANTSYERIDGQLRATGVFDLGDAHIGDGEEDLVRFLFRRKREQREAFVAAYSARHPFRPGAGDRIALHALADLLFIWEVSKRVTNWFGDASFVDTAEAVVDTVRMIDTNTRPRPS